MAANFKFQPWRFFLALPSLSNLSRLIGWESMPGGGTTDYAVDIFHEAIKNREYTCFVSKNRVLPMMYMDDAIKATIGVMEAPCEKIKISSGNQVDYNYLKKLSKTPKKDVASLLRL